jgi:hypothetical protein
MKKLLTTLITSTVLAASLSTAVNAGEQITVSGKRPDAIVLSGADAMYLRLCNAVISNNKLNLHSTLKRERVSYQQIQDGLVCNGQDPVTFAMYNGSEETAELIARRTRKVTSTIVAKN